MRPPAFVSFRLLSLTLLAITYAYLLPHGINWFDTAELTAASCSLSFSHPPGQPLYHLLVHLAMQLGFEPALTANAFSALCLLLALHLCGSFIFRSLPFRLSCTSRDLWSALALLFTGLIPAIAWQGLRAEVYAPAFLCSAAVLLLLQKRQETARNFPSSWRLYLAGFASGAGLITHLLAVGVVLAALSLEALCNGSAWRILRRPLPYFRTFGVGMLLGLFPLSYFPLRSGSNHILQWDLIHSPAQFLQYISGAYYASSFTVSAVIPNLSKLLQLLVLHLDLPMLALSGFGIVQSIQSKRFSEIRLPVFLAATAGVALPLRVFHVDNPDIQGYLCPALFGCVILAVHGAIALHARFQALPLRIAVQRSAVACLGGIILSFHILQALPALRTPRIPAQEVLADFLARELPPNALLIFGNDDLFFPLLYLQECKSQRLDVLALGQFAIRYPAQYERFRAVYPRDLPVLQARTYQDRVDALVKSIKGKRPVVIQPQEGLSVSLSSFQPSGLWYAERNVATSSAAMGSRDILAEVLKTPLNSYGHHGAIALAQGVKVLANEREDLRERLARLRILLDFDQHDPETWGIYGSTALALGMKERGRDAIRQALALQPTDAIALLNLAGSAKTEAERKESLDFMRKAGAIIERDPQLRAMREALQRGNLRSEERNASP